MTSGTLVDDRLSTIALARIAGDLAATPFARNAGRRGFPQRWYALGGRVMSGGPRLAHDVSILDAAAGIDGVLARARRRLDRLTPLEAAEAVAAGALLVDIRPRDQRLWEGGVPGALIIERNVLEWRLDPASDARLPEADSYDRHIVLFCSEGYATSLAAVTLQDVGLWRATDLIGGFHAWAAAGLPVTSPRSSGTPAPHPPATLASRRHLRGGLIAGHTSR